MIHALALGLSVALAACSVDAARSRVEGADAATGSSVIVRDSGDNWEAGVADGGNAGIADSGDAGIADAGDVAIADAGEAGIADVGDAGIADSGDADVAEVGDASIADGGDAAVADGGEAGVAEVGEAAPLETAACLRPIATHDGPNPYTYSAEWSPVDDFILSGSLGELRLLRFDRSAGRLEQLATSGDQANGIYVKWSPDGRFALSVSTDVRLFAIGRDPPAISEVARYTGHRGDVCAVAWSPDGQYAITGSKDSTVRLLAVSGDEARLEQRAIFIGHAGKVFGVAWSPDGRDALSVGEDGTFRLLAVDPAAGSLRELAEIRDDNEENAVSWPTMGQPVLTGSWGVRNVVQLWSIDPVRGEITAAGELLEHPSGVMVLEWSRDGRRLVTGGHGDTIHLFGYRGGAFESIATLADPMTGVHAVSWSPDGNYMVLTASQGDHVTLLDARRCP